MVAVLGDTCGENHHFRSLSAIKVAKTAADLSSQDLFGVVVLFLSGFAEK